MPDNKQKQIILIGAGGHAKTIVDTIEISGIYKIAGFIDIKCCGANVYRGYKIIGNDNDLEQLYASGIANAFISIGYMGKSDIREKIYEKIKNIGFNIPVITDRSAIVAEDAIIGEGTYIGRGAIINASAKIGKMCIINSAAIVEHECDVGDFSHIAVGAVVCGQSNIGKCTFTGANSTVCECLDIGNNCIIGAGSVVIHNICDNKKVAGNPAKYID